MKKTSGVIRNISFDISLADYTPHSDGVLLIDGIRLHVNRTYLALYSPFFSALFFRRFRESNLQEVPIKDVEVKEFEELLHVIYPSRKPITAENVEFLLKLGDRFQIQDVMRKCVKFLMMMNQIPVDTNLLWADQYSLADLCEICMLLQT